MFCCRGKSCFEADSCAIATLSLVEAVHRCPFAIKNSFNVDLFLTVEPRVPEWHCMRRCFSFKLLSFDCSVPLAWHTSLLMIT